MSRTIARESFRSTIITYIGTGIGFLTTFFVLTKYLTKEEVGLTRTLIEVATLLSGLGLCGLTTSINRYFPYFRDTESATDGHKQGAHHGFFYYISLIALVGCLIALPLYAVLHEPLGNLFAQNSPLFVSYYWLVVPLSLCIVFWSAWELYTVQLLHLSMPKAIREIGLRVLLLLVYLLFALELIDQPQMLWGIVIVYGLCTLVALYYLGRIVPLSLKHDWSFVSTAMRRDFTRFTGMTVLATVGTMLAGRMDFFMVTLVDSGGLDSVAVFSIAFFMASFIDIPARAIIGITTPHIAEAMKQGDKLQVNKLYQDASYYQLLLGLLVFALIWCNIDNLYHIMPNGAAYSTGKYIFLFLGLAKLIDITFTGSHPIVSSSLYYHWTLYYMLWFCLVAFLSNLYLIPKLGTVGSAVATLSSCIVCYGSQQLLVSRRLGVHPFSSRQLRLIPFSLALWLTGTLVPSLSSAWLDGALRSSLILTTALGSLYLLRLSPEAEHIIARQLKRLKPSR